MKLIKKVIGKFKHEPNGKKNYFICGLETKNV